MTWSRVSKGSRASAGSACSSTRPEASSTRAGKAAKLSALCDLVEGDMTDKASLRRAVDGVDTVVHLVAIRQGREEQFERIMAQGTRDLVSAAQEAGVGRFVHMSALGVSEETKD